jgi:hypothetical protein
MSRVAGRKTSDLVAILPDPNGSLMDEPFIVPIRYPGQIEAILPDALPYALQLRNVGRNRETDLW